jgi:hypothetical protein
MEMRNRIGVDNICLGGRLPAQRLDVARRPRGTGAVFDENRVPDDDIRKMTHENAMRWYSFDPFVHVPKEEATVGALRRPAAGHDVSTMSRSTRVRTADEKLEGFRKRAERAVAATGADTGMPARFVSASTGRRGRAGLPAGPSSQSPRAAPASRTWASASVRALAASPPDGAEQEPHDRLDCGAPGPGKSSK